MKKVTQFLGMICLFPFFSMAQISIDMTDMAQVGDIVTRHSDTLALVSQGSAGANQTWDMTTATIHSSETTEALDPSSTPYSSSFSNANLSMTNDNAAFLYFDQNADSLVALGFAGDLLGTGSIITAPFSPTLLVHHFPRTYGDNFTDTYGIDVTTSGSDFGVYQVRFKRLSVVYDSTDAWGTLITPDATYDALRTKYIEYSNDSIWVQLLPITPFTLFQATFDTAVTYNWLAKNGKLAVAELSLDSLGQPQTFTWVSTSVGIEDEIGAQIDAQIYPIPASNQVSIRLADNDKGGTHLLEIYTLEGKLVSTDKIELLSGKPFSFDISQYTSGVYTWTLRNVATQREVNGKLPIVRD